MRSKDSMYTWTHRRKHKTYFSFREKTGGAFTLIYIICVLVFLLCSFHLVKYYIEYRNSIEVSDMLRSTYHDVSFETPRNTVSAEHETGMEPTAAPQTTMLVETQHNALVMATASAVPTIIEEMPYPNNKHAFISSRFAKIRRQNQDIIGWITIDDLLDEAVVQRDNKYYLNRDYRGYHNSNGALFLDENCDLSTRPYTMMIYGHNMKTGAMFGALRNYENVNFYRNNPFFRLDTAYEDGRFVIFAVSNISTDLNNYRYFSFGSLLSSSISDREYAIEQIKMFSLYKTQIEVEANDQIVLLITCMGDETERRLIAARRIRNDEDETQLLSLVKRTKEK